MNPCCGFHHVSNNSSTILLEVFSEHIPCLSSNHRYSQSASHWHWENQGSGCDRICRYCGNKNKYNKIANSWWKQPSVSQILSNTRELLFLQHAARIKREKLSQVTKTWIMCHYMSQCRDNNAERCEVNENFKESWSHQDKITQTKWMPSQSRQLMDSF